MRFKERGVAAWRTGLKSCKSGWSSREEKYVVKFVLGHMMLGYYLKHEQTYRFYRMIIYVQIGSNVVIQQVI